MRRWYQLFCLILCFKVRDIGTPLRERAIHMGYPCVNSTATILYLNEADVKEALHVPFVLPGIEEWHMCTRYADRLCTGCCRNLYTFNLTAILTTTGIPRAQI